MKLTEVDSYNISLYVGFKERSTGRETTIELAYKLIQEYCDKNGLCVSVTPTKFIYTNGGENGCIIGFINYPRFPSTKEKY